MNQPPFESINDFLLQQNHFPWPPQPSHQPMAASPAPMSLIPLQHEPYAPAHDPSLSLLHDMLLLNAGAGPAPMASDQLFSEGAAAATQQQQQPTRVRKKPGRKPNPATPFLRKAQNRAAQRAFRERKEQHLRELEESVQALRKERKAMAKRLGEATKEARAYKAEACFLRSMLLTVHMACMHNRIDIPEHAPFFSQQTIDEIAHTAPLAIASYKKAIQQYDKTMAELVTEATGGASRPRSPPSSNAVDDMDEQAIRWEDNVLARSSDEAHEVTGSSSPPPAAAADDDDDLSPSSSSNQQPHDDNDNDMDALMTQPESVLQGPGGAAAAAASSKDAVHQLSIQLRIQSKLMALGPTTSGLHPTYLQLTVPHDPRIDLIPSRMMRDRLIIFRDIIDYDRYFSVLLNRALFYGGDPTDPLNWKIPLDHFGEFWFMFSLYRSRDLRTFRALQASSRLTTAHNRPGLQLEYGNGFDDDGGVLDDYLNETLDSEQQRAELPQPDEEGSEARLSQSLYASFRSPPSLRDPVRSTTLDDMVELVNLSQVLKL